MRSKFTYQDFEVSSWNAFERKISELTEEARKPGLRWIFRGEGSTNYRMSTSLEREAKSLGQSVSSLPSLEERMIREFRRRLHHYTPHVPHHLDYVELLAMMQHFGAPTRLQDWTYSPYVAAYFAVERAKRSCVVWVLEWSTIRSDVLFKSIEKEAQEKGYPIPAFTDASGLPTDPSKLSQLMLVSFLFAHPRRMVVAVNPYRLNDRLTVQQGVFIMPGDLSLSLETNLAAAITAGASLTRLTIRLTKRSRTQFLLNLHRSNISRATLFPGLPGFAESLRTRLAIPETLSS
jgi:hypothetical protein